MCFVRFVCGSHLSLSQEIESVVGVDAQVQIAKLRAELESAHTLLESAHTLGDERVRSVQVVSQQQIEITRLEGLLEASVKSVHSRYVGWNCCGVEIKSACAYACFCLMFLSLLVTNLSPRWMKCGRG